jgi:very-short-patch-repair endonuclease
MTGSEKVLWEEMGKTVWPEGTDWKAQEVVLGYIPDFYEPSSRIVVEVDGSIHNVKRVRLNDLRKQRHFAKEGILTVRYTNDEVKVNVAKILRSLKGLISRRVSARTDD